MKKNVSIIRSAVGSLASIGIIDFLKENSIKIIGIDITDDNVGKYFVDSYYKIPPSNPANEEELVQELSRIIKKENVKFFLSGPESEIILVQKNNRLFQELNCKIFHSDYETLHIISNKEALYDYLKDKTDFIGEFCCLSKYSPKLIDSEKIIIKPKFGRGSAGVHIVNNNAEDLQEIKRKLVQDQYIVQKIYKGKEYSVDVLCDMEGRLLNIVPRIRQQTESGIAVVAETVMVSRLIEHTVQINQILGLKGFSCIQFIEHDGIYYLTDINPRFGGGAILSLRSSVIMQQNLINLFREDNDKLVYNNFDFQSFKMYRYYKEEFISL